MPGPTESNDLLTQAGQAQATQDWQTAAGLYQRVLADGDRDVSKDANTNWFLGQCLLQLGQLQPAIDAFTAGNWPSDQYQPEIDAARESGGISGDDGEGGDGAGDAQGGGSSNPAYDQAFEVACDAFAAGNYDGAAQRFEELLNAATTTDDQKKEIRWNLGMCHFHLGQPKLGVEQMTQGGYQESEYASVLEGLVLHHSLQAAQDAFDSGSFDQAVSLYGQLSNDSTIPADQRKQIFWQLGMAHFHMNDEEAGRRAMEQGGFAESDYHEAFEAATAGR